MADWLEVSLRGVDEGLREVIADLMGDYGYQGVVVEQEGIMPLSWGEENPPPATHFTVRAYLPVDDQLAATRARLEAALARFPLEAPLYRDVAEDDWAEAWKRFYHPLRVGERIFVRPAWEGAGDARPNDVEIVLDPGMAFGTGTHPTTQLCLAALEDWMPPGVDVLDLGCGSGILSIAAAKLGAGRVYAVDVDPVAVAAAEENLTRNGVRAQVDLATGGLPEVLALKRPFDFAAVNILARIIVQMCEMGLGNVVKPGGRAVFAGLIVPQTDKVEAALRLTGLVPLRRRQLADWVLIEAERPA